MGELKRLASALGMAVTDFFYVAFPTRKWYHYEFYGGP